MPDTDKRTKLAGILVDKIAKANSAEEVVDIFDEIPGLEDVLANHAVRTGVIPDPQTDKT